jgi:hypothetical protein
MSVASFGEFHLLEHPPLVLVAGVRSLDRIASCVHSEDQVDDVLQRDVVVVRSVKAAPAYMQPDLFPRDVVQCVIERIDAHRGVFAIVGKRDVGQRTVVPAPQPISTTRSPGWAAAKSNSSFVRAATARSIRAYWSAHARVAALFQNSICPAFPVAA